MVNAMNKVLRDCILDITMSFLDDIPIKGCPKDAKDESIVPNGCRGEVGFRTTGDPSGRPPVRGIWPKIVPGKGKGHLGNERRVWIGHGGLTVLGSMRLLPHLDSTLCARS